MPLLLRPIDSNMLAWISALFAMRANFGKTAKKHVPWEALFALSGVEGEIILEWLQIQKRLYGRR